MSFLEKNNSEFEVEISGFTNNPFYAKINANTRDLKLISEAVKITDELYPQKFGPHGTHYYSFVTREHFLNLLLRFYDSNSTLPNLLELEKLQKICQQKIYHQRDVDVLENKKSHKTQSKKLNLFSYWYWFLLFLCILQAIQEKATIFNQ